MSEVIPSHDAASVLRFEPEHRTAARASGSDVLTDPPWLSAWLTVHRVERCATVGDLRVALRRSRPLLLLVDARLGDGALQACTACKADPYTALVPCVVFGAGDVASGAVRAALFASGADDVLANSVNAPEGAARLDALLRRAARDRAAQPTTGLPGPPAIDAWLAARLRTGESFAACYADLDHFKEYNDRYGFYEGDRVIRMVARLLYDVASGAAGLDAFVGHIGGDDFLCVLPLDAAPTACATMIETFDLLAPLQYNAADRRAGYYLGKDRRGQLHRVPLMTLSIGVATTERRHFGSAAEVSRLASEMKSFAKTLPGSVFAFDRRATDDVLPPTPLTEVV